MLTLKKQNKKTPYFPVILTCSTPSTFFSFFLNPYVHKTHSKAFLVTDSQMQRPPGSALSRTPPPHPPPSSQVETTGGKGCCPIPSTELRRALPSARRQGTPSTRPAAAGPRAEPLPNPTPGKGSPGRPPAPPPPQRRQGHRPDPQRGQAVTQRGSRSTRPAEAPPPASAPNPVRPGPLYPPRPRRWGSRCEFSDPKRFPFSGGGAGTQSPFC